ncbi:hypothetical protein CLAFUW4_09048 [Fulvia fulva]|nr:hypothetical protein CLAFUR4_09054 [Fulvia fulva]KAK4614596.1 hypothetical protein CLAFUR0_09046 [Fulvia fulva]WPV20037.1 hypothetical protein CLAFUW4_09048 [Fulvia fulva]WPV35439.1 hypothetical protein CLAFUW7_09049 [Fulvia fulva]
MIHRRRTDRVFVFAGLLAVAFLIRYVRVNEARTLSFPGLGALKAWTNYTYVDNNTAPLRPHTSYCDALVANGLKDLVVVIKTGSTEMYGKLPIHLTTTLACEALTYRVYSDYPQSFGHNLEVRDALHPVLKDVLGQSKDGFAYDKLLKHIKSGADPGEIAKESARRQQLGEEAANGGDNISRRLDKWKFLPMISACADEEFAGKKWFFFMEADTAVSLPNLLMQLATFDPTKPIYAGSQTMIGHMEFAHGGSGILMSAPAVGIVRKEYMRNQRHWDVTLADRCCGDQILAEVLYAAETPVRLTTSFPLFQGESVISLDWSENHWCRPAISWHHVDAAAVDKLFHFERSWRSFRPANIPMLHRDVFLGLVMRRIKSAPHGRIIDWDNLSADWVFEQTGNSPDPAASYHSAASCEGFCTQEASCMQWAWRKGSCRANRRVRFGWKIGMMPDQGSAGDRVPKARKDELTGAVSGWMVQRILDVMVKRNCEEVKEVWVKRREDRNQD